MINRKHGNPGNMTKDQTRVSVSIGDSELNVRAFASIHGIRNVHFSEIPCFLYQLLWFCWCFSFLKVSTNV